MINKGKAVKEGKVWGLGAYHGQSDYAVTNESDAHFKKYLQDNNIKRKYLHYAWTREAIRVANPRPDYSGYKEMEPTNYSPLNIFIAMKNTIIKISECSPILRAHRLSRKN